MKRINHYFISLIVLGFFGCSLFVTPVLAALNTGITGDGIAANVATQAGYGQTNEFTLSMIVGMVVQFLFGFLGLLFTLLMLYAGYNWMTAQGDSSKVETAQNTMQQSIIGMVVCFSAYAISSLVIRTFFGG